MNRIIVSILLIMFLVVLIGCDSSDDDVLVDEQDEETLTTDDTLQDEDDELMDEQDEDDEFTRDLLQTEYKKGYQEWCENNLDTGTCASEEKIICQSEVIAQNTEYPDEFLQFIEDEGFEMGQANFRRETGENLHSIIIEKCLD